MFHHFFETFEKCLKYGFLPFDLINRTIPKHFGHSNLLAFCG